jgi:putative transcriptional regulator
MSDSLRGQLLIASPALHDYFRRAVVLVLEHNEEGALGVVLNRPSETAVTEAVPDLAALAGDDDLVRVGGPVSPRAVVALGDFEDPTEPVVGSVGLIDPDDLSPAIRRTRVFAGYAGWAPDQLDAELEQEAWIVELATADDVFHEGDLWPVALQRKGGGFSLLATMPADPSLN